MTRRARRWAAAALAATATLAWAAPAHADQVRDAEWHLASLRIADAHQISQGEGVSVGLLDTGVDATHPDLAGSILPGTNILEGTGDARTDPDGHGTSMAGLIAGHGTGGNGVLGIAPKAKILPVRVYSNFKIGNSSLELAKSIRWATEHGAKVISISLHANDLPDLKAAVKAAIAADIVIVAAVGNAPENSYVRHPAAYDGVVAVAGVDRAGDHAEISVTGDKVLVSAPATDTTSTYPGGRYFTGTGTSGATAIVAGVAALIRAKYPQLTASQVIQRITDTAIDKGPKGRDPQYGYGIVDPVSALAPTVKPRTSTAPAEPAETDSSEPSEPANNKRWIPIAIGAICCGGLAITVIVITIVLITRNRRRRNRPPIMPQRQGL